MREAGHAAFTSGKIGVREKTVSIVMTYFERLRQLRNTLDSFRFHGYGKDVEVIIVDDGSERERIKIDDGEYDFSIKVIELDPRKKWYHNSCVPFNVGFAQCSSELIIIQNAECLHYSNIVDYARKNLNETNYLAFGCYSINSATFEKICGIPSFADKIGALRFKDTRATFDGEEGWYNHSAHNPVAYHFCTALTKNNLQMIRGFDLAYAKGIGFDDNEFIYRINESRLRIQIINDCIVVHQHHYGNNRKSFTRDRLINRNRILYHVYSKNQRAFAYYALSMLMYYSLGWHRKCTSVLKYVVKFIHGLKRLRKKSAKWFGQARSVILRGLMEPLFIHVPDVRNIPVIINNRNRATYLRLLVDWLRAQGMERIFVLDNDSDYPPLLKYYTELQHAGVQIIKLDKNAGPYSLWRTGLYKRFWSSYYIYTDSDVVPNGGFGLDGIAFLLSALRKHKSLGKIGFGIRIDDLPDCFAQKDFMIGIELKYRRLKLDAGIFHAAVDTTFALYAPFHKGGPELAAARTDHPYLIRHLPWYVDSNNKSDEEKYFEAHASSHSSMYANKIKIG